MKKEKLFSTINSGKYKGKKIELPQGLITRSTKSILKSSLFDTLQFEIIDKNFVEVFGGSGSVGLEAISKGAKRAYFIEREKNSFAILKQNCQQIDKNSCELYFGDSFKIYFNIIKKIQTTKTKTYFYFDPPFNIRENMQNIYDKVFNLIQNTPSTITQKIIIEHISKMKIPNHVGEFRLIKTKKFGKSSLSYLIPIKSSTD